MSKKAKIIKWVKAAAAVLAAAVIAVVGVLFFPLTGEKHIEIWSAG